MTSLATHQEQVLAEARAMDERYAATNAENERLKRELSAEQMARADDNSRNNGLLTEAQAHITRLQSQLQSCELRVKGAEDLVVEFRTASGLLALAAQAVLAVGNAHRHAESDGDTNQRATILLDKIREGIPEVPHVK